MAKAKTKVYTIYIAADPNEKNAKKIQYERFQKMDKPLKFLLENSLMFQIGLQSELKKLD